jgi:uncharacterized protein
MKRPIFFDQHPVWFVFILEIIIIFVYLLSGTAAAVMKLTNLALYGIANVTLVVISVGLITALGWWKVIGFQFFKRSGDWWFFLIPFIPMAINLIPGINILNFRHLVVVFFITLSVGFVEETFFRGLMLYSLRNSSVWFAILVTSLLFGFTHAMNITAGKSVLDTVSQIMYAIAIGIAFAALVIRKGVIWPLMIAHFLTDFFYFLQRTNGFFSPTQELIITFSITVIFISYGLWLMFHPVREPIQLKESLT